MATSTPMGGFPVPDNGDNINNMGGQVANFGTQSEPFYVLSFANAAARDAVVTSTTGHVGQLVWLTSPGRFYRLATISGSVVTWAELGFAPLRCSASYTIPNTLASGGEIGLGVPTGSFGGGYGKGANGPTVPADGDYVVTVIASNVLAAGSAVGSSSYRTFLALQIGGTTIARVNFGIGEDRVNVTAITPLITAGTEISASLYQNSGQLATGTVTWTVSRNSVAV